jgi:hypothetical protein
MPLTLCAGVFIFLSRRSHPSVVQMKTEVRQLREQRAADQERRELHRELQGLRERLAVLEGRKQERTEKPTAGADE